MAKVVRKKDQTFELLMRQFRRKVQEDGIIQELRKREYYLSPSQKRREKSKAAQIRARRSELKTSQQDAEE